MTQPPSPLTMLFSHHTKRREFITLFCGTAAVPLAARGQPDRIRKVGILIAFSERDRVVQARVAAFREELRQLGRSEGCCPISVGPHRSMGQSEILEPRPLRRGRLRARWGRRAREATSCAPRRSHADLCGGVGTGWDHKTARAIRRALEPLARSTSPLTTPIKKKEPA
jgi:hypothetical protein